METSNSLLIFNLCNIKYSTMSMIYMCLRNCYRPKFYVSPAIFPEATRKIVPSYCYSLVECLGDFAIFFQNSFLFWIMKVYDFRIDFKEYFLSSFSHHHFQFFLSLFYYMCNWIYYMIFLLCYYIIIFLRNFFKFKICKIDKTCKI